MVVLVGKDELCVHLYNAVDGTHLRKVTPSDAITGKDHFGARTTAPDRTAAHAHVCSQPHSDARILANGARFSGVSPSATAAPRR